MGKKSIVHVKFTVKTDGEYIEKWLMQPGVLRGFPMSDRREIDHSVQVWMEYAKQGCSLTAFYKKQPCGCATLYVQTVKKLKHQCLFVIIIDEAYRNQGIGGLLLMHLERLAKETFHIELLHLEVYSDNPAIHLYRKRGFVYYGVHPSYLKGADGTYYDKVLMQKWLV